MVLGSLLLKLGVACRPTRDRMFVSYAQNFEDVLLWRALQHVGKGFYIDIGAHDPVVDSVSRAFYEQGWRGVHVEPTAHYAQALRHARPDETVLQAAVGGESAVMSLFEFPSTGLSTGESAIARRHQGIGFIGDSVNVLSVSLGSILDHWSDRDIHWLKVDVEGMEERVLRSWAPSAVRPWIVVIESTLPLTRTPSHMQWQDVLEAAQYRFAYFDGLNRYYVSELHADLLDAFGLQPNVFDDFTFAGTASHPFTVRQSEQLARANTQVTALTAKVEALQAKLDDIGSQAPASALLSSLASQLAAFGEAADARHLQLSRHDEELAAALAELLLERQALAARVADLNAELAALTIAAGQAAELQRVVGELSGHLTAARTSGDAARQEANELRARLPALADAHEQRQNEARLRLHTLESAVASRSVEADGLQAALAQCRQRLDETLTAREALGQALQRIEEGRLWRYTAFLRPRETSAATAAVLHPAATDLSASPAQRFAKAEDADFVQLAYQSVLHRAVDPASAKFWLRRLQGGMARQSLIEQLLASPEAASANGASLPALAAQLAAVDLSDRAGRKERRHERPHPDAMPVRLEALLQLDGAAFVSAAYDALLLREPDEAGGRAFLAALGNGESKLAVLKSISDSAERRSLGTRVDGLEAALRAARLLQVPLIGRLVAFSGRQPPVDGNLTKRR